MQVAEGGMQTGGLFWSGGRVAWAGDGVDEVARRFRDPAYVVVHPETGHVGAGLEGGLVGQGGFPVQGFLPGIYPEWLGDRMFSETHGVRFPYVVGEMARGITSVRMVIEAGKAGMLGFFGSAGLPPDQVEEAILTIGKELGPAGPWGMNLIHAPGFPQLEDMLVDLFLHHGVPRVCASAFVGLTPAVVRYACKGLSLAQDGRILRHHHLLAKVSRPEIARHFMAPPPEGILQTLVSKGLITQQEAALAARLPLAEDVTVEGDSGGHTDSQVLGSIFPIIVKLRDTLEKTHGFPVRLGAAGGLGTPQAVASAFALGAAYVLTGSVNQSAVEAGVAELTRAMLAKASVGDVSTCPSADMFEMGAKVQVLKKGTLFPSRANQLYELYVRYPSLDAIPKEIREKLERQVFRNSLDSVWEETRAFFAQISPRDVERAEKDPKHKMALAFRWYLGLSSRWPIVGDQDRAIDYQIWCGPAMGSFNEWVAGSFLEPLENRTVAQIGLNLLEGAAKVTRAYQLRVYGVAVPNRAFSFVPRPLACGTNR